MKINITDIENKENKTIDVQFSQVYEEFNPEIPVVANLTLTLIGDLIKVSGNIKADLILTCDVCLKEFTKSFDINVEEFFTKYNLNEDCASEFEIKNDGFIEDLNGENEIDIKDFVYQSIILNMPNKIVCDINCNGDENLNKYLKKEITDPRLEVFKTIKIQKDKG